MAFESINVSGPEVTKRSQPGVKLLQRFVFQLVETTLSVHGALHETSVAQHAQVLRHGRLRHAELTLYLAHRLL